MSQLQSRLRRWQRYFDSVVKKYGYGNVPAHDIYGTFESVSAIFDGGFAPSRPGLYARQVDADMFHALKLQRVKGGAYNLLWGVSLAYVPQVQGKRLRWHRTLKSVDLDLFEDPVNYFDLDNVPMRVSSRYYAEDGHGPVFLRKTMQRMWAALAEPVQSWFFAVSDVQGVLAKCEEQLARRWNGLGHNPDPRLVHASTLRRVGRLSEAHESLYLYLRQPGVSSVETELLRKAFGAPA